MSETSEKLHTTRISLSEGCWKSLETYLVMLRWKNNSFSDDKKTILTSDFSTLDNLTFVRVSARDWKTWKMGRHFPVRVKVKKN